MNEELSKVASLDLGYRFTSKYFSTLLKMSFLVRSWMFCFLSLLFIGMGGSLVAQSYNFLNFSVEEGLPQSEVEALAIDSKGFLWLGTNGGGLSRFDGSEFKTWTVEDGLIENAVKALVVDKNDHLWISQDNSGVSKFDGVDFQHFKGDDSLRLNRIYCLEVDRENRIWALNSGKQLLCNEGEGFELFDKYEGHEDTLASWIEVDSMGTVWVAMSEGFVTIDGKSVGYVSYGENPPFEQLLVFEIGPDNTFYFATRQKVWRKRRGEFELLHQFSPGDGLDNLLLDSSNRLWMFGGFGVGLWKEGGFTMFQEQEGLWDVSGNMGVEDPMGNVWIGMRGGGLSRFIGEGFVHYSKGTPLYRNAVFAVEEMEPGRYLIGTEHGLFEFENGNFTEVTLPSPVASPYIYGIDKVNSTEYYARSLEGVYQVKNGKARIVKEKGTGKSILADGFSIDSQGRIWTGARRGMWLIEGDKAMPGVEIDSIYANPFESFLEGPNGETYFFGGVDGLWIYKDGEMSKFDEGSGLPHWSTSVGLIDKHGAFWVGTNGGLCRYKDGEFCYLTHRDGLNADLIYILEQDEMGAIWVGTERGLNRIEIDENSDPLEIQTYGKAEGFVGVETNLGASLLDSQGKLWFGTIQGVTCYNPKADNRELELPSVHIREVKLDLQAVDWARRGDSLLPWYDLPVNPQLAATENHLRFEFKGVSLNNPRKIRYKYMLEGLTQTWSPPVTETHATYPLLPSGKYTFKVMVGTTDGKWNPEIATFSFSIATPFYQTWSFRIAVFVALLALVFLVIRVRIQAIERQRRILREKVDRRTKELQKQKDKVEEANRVKSDFLAKMSHEIRTPMNGVIGMTDLLRRTPLSEQQQQFVSNIHVSGQNLLSLINDILDFSRIESGKLDLESVPLDLRRLIEEVLDILAYGAFKKGLEMVSYVDPEIRGPIIGDPARLKQVLVNLVGNAIKFTDEGEVFVQAKLLKRGAESATIQISVRDSGIGIPEEKFQSLFESFSQVDASTTRKYGGTGLGLAISFQLARMMGGEMWVESESGKGSEFFFTLEGGLSAPWKLPEGGHPARGLEGKRILMAVSNLLLRDVLSRFLDHWEVEAFHFSGLEEVLDAAKEEPPYFILVDSKMVREDALRIAKRIEKAAEAGAWHYALLCEPGLSINIKPSLKEKGRILNKPLKRDELLDALLLKAPSASRNESPKVDAQLAQRIPLRILIAEDNPINVEVATGMLNSLGYEPDAAENGLVVLEKLQEAAYDLIFMDVQMPEMDGLEATRQIIKRFSKERRPIIVAMTANAMESDRQACLEAGMNTFISKPFVLEDLVDLLQSLIQITGMDKEGKASEAVVEVEQVETEQEEAPASKEAEKEGAAVQDSGPDKYEYIDLGMLYEASNGESAFVLAISGKLIKKLPEALEELRGHIEDKNWDQVRAVAHRTKSSAAYTGAADLKEMFRQLEQMAREEENLEEIPAKMDALAEYVGKVVSELKMAVADLSN